MKKYEDIKIREDLIIRITKIQEVNSNRILARVDIVINNFIVITNIRIVQGNNNLFVSKYLLDGDCAYEGDGVMINSGKFNGELRSEVQNKLCQKR